MPPGKRRRNWSFGEGNRHHRRYLLGVSYGITGLAYGTTNSSIAELTCDLSGSAFSLDGPVGTAKLYQVIKRTASEQQSRPRVRGDSFGIFKPSVSIGVQSTEALAYK